MNKKFGNVRSLYSKINSILLKDWDPIGINDIPEAQDEYDAYIPPIYELLASEKSEHEIFNYLWWVEIEHMGLSGNRQQTQIIAKKLARLGSK